jgi:hypothetical protein
MRSVTATVFRQPLGTKPTVGCSSARPVARRSVLVRADEGLSYKSAGVDIEAGNELVRRIQKLNPNIGGFSGMVPFGDSFLVAGTDGVGTKLKLAFDLNKHDTVGIDLVAMSVNDIITSGAKPMFFLDYFACGKLDVDTAEQVRQIFCSFSASPSRRPILQCFSPLLPEVNQSSVCKSHVWLTDFHNSFIIAEAGMIPKRHKCLKIENSR